MASESEDVTMKEAPEEKQSGESGGDAATEEEQKPPKKDKDLLTIEGCVIRTKSVFHCPVSFSSTRTSADIREQIRVIERGIAQKESRFIHRAARSLLKLRKQLNDNVLWHVVTQYYPSGGRGIWGVVRVTSPGVFTAGSLRGFLIQFIEEVALDSTCHPCLHRLPSCSQWRQIPSSKYISHVPGVGDRPLLHYCLRWRCLFNFWFC